MFVLKKFVVVMGVGFGIGCVVVFVFVQVGFIVVLFGCMEVLLCEMQDVICVVGGDVQVFQVDVIDEVLVDYVFVWIV